MIFRRGNFRDRHGKLERADFGADVAAQPTGQTEESGGAQIGQAAFLNLGLDLLELFAQRTRVDIARGENGLLERLPFDGLEVLDFEPELAAPVDEGLS